MLVLIAFSVLVGATALSFVEQGRSPNDKSHLSPYKTKSLTDWILDGLGLLVQGVLIPLLQMTMTYHLWALLLPTASGAVYLGVIPAFLLSFAGVDYLYYWNHRWLHSRRAWAIHRVHHTITQMDVLGTSRNTLWSSVFIVYLWVHALMIYLLADPTGYVLGISLTSALDLWRHSQFGPRPGSILHRALSPWLILPQDHAFHHQGLYEERSDRPCQSYNFGANLNLWDRLHHTYRPSLRPAKLLGIPANLSLLQQLLFPF